MATGFQPDSLLQVRFCGFHLLERLLKVHANWLFLAANSPFFDERAFWIRCNFVFHEILPPFFLIFWQSFKEICNSVEHVVTLEIFRENRWDLSSERRIVGRDKIHPAPDISSRSKFSLSCTGCMNFQTEAIMTVDKAEICVRFEGLEEMTGK